MICPACEKGQMIKINPLGIRHIYAVYLRCIACRHQEQYRVIRAA